MSENNNKNNDNLNNLNEVSALERCEIDLKKQKESYLHLAADFENFKKRVERDNSKVYLMAQIDVILKFLPVIDNFQRAFKQGLENSNPEVKAWLQGFNIVNEEFKKLFEKLEIQEIPMDKFDPELHEAVAHIDFPSKDSGDIVDYVEKGYTYKGALIRVAKVAVAK